MMEPMFHMYLAAHCDHFEESKSISMLEEMEGVAVLLAMTYEDGLEI